MNTKPHHLGFLIDVTACVDETLRHPRTQREAFGSHSDRLPGRITFLHSHHTGWFGIVAAVLVLVAFVWGAS